MAVDAGVSASQYLSQHLSRIPPQHVSQHLSRRLSIQDQQGIYPGR